MRKKEFIVIGIVIALFIFISILSLTSINRLQGNARVVNFVGIVRGATQKLIKEELMGYPDDELIERLDAIIYELINGEGPNGLVVLDDETYLADMSLVSSSWGELKAEIMRVRDGGDPGTLFDLSQSYFDLVNDTVFSAEAFSEREVSRSLSFLKVVNSVFALVVITELVFAVMGFSMKKRADMLGLIAYIDPLTQMNNRARCEQLIGKLAESPSAGDAVAIMFDMNNLKLVNDFLGHKGGDRIIREFARILKCEAESVGFVGRYGGDEFLAIFEDADPGEAERFIAAVAKSVAAHNVLQTNEIEKISYAAGYAAGPCQNIDEIISEADKAMYVNKRGAKKG
jgi:diguanylate cyclase (GGDEF)-like protein